MRSVSTSSVWRSFSPLSLNETGLTSEGGCLVDEMEELSRGRFRGPLHDRAMAVDFSCLFFDVGDEASRLSHPSEQIIEELDVYACILSAISCNDRSTFESRR